jgi:hypothetical protein
MRFGKSKMAVETASCRGQMRTLACSIQGLAAIYTCSLLVGCGSDSEVKRDGVPLQPDAGMDVVLMGADTGASVLGIDTGSTVDSDQADGPKYWMDQVGTGNWLCPIVRRSAHCGVRMAAPPGSAVPRTSTTL